MWYVIQVMSGREEQTILMMEKNISCGIVEKCFIPMRRLKKKYSGKWHEVTEKLFPGYVFLITNQPRLLYQELKRIPALTKLLGSCEDYFTALTEEDVQFLKELEGMAGERCENTFEDNFENKDEIIQRESCIWKNERNSRKYHECQTFGTSEVGLSEIIIGEDCQIQVVSGPLKNLEGKIKKINLHKRIAMVETEFMGNRSVIHLGVEIVRYKKTKGRSSQG